MARRKHRIASIIVTIENSFSNVVFAKIFPIVLNKNIRNKIHRAIVIIPEILGKKILPDLARTIKKHDIIIINDMISKFKSCVAVFIRPPQRKLTGAKSNNTIPKIIDR